MMRQALVIRHVAHEGLAGFAAPITAAGYVVDMLDVSSEDFATADLGAPDLLVLLGGPMAVYERDAYPWIGHEIDRVAARLAQRRPTLGICLGAQIIAVALGAEVTAGPVREVGFAPVVLTQAGGVSPLASLAEVPLLHWHGDGFLVPDGATLLARTTAYPQAFSLGATLLALQCHPEMGGADDGIESWIEAAEGYLEGAGVAAAQLRADHRRHGAAAAVAGQVAIAAWLAGLPT